MRFGWIERLKRRFILDRGTRKFIEANKKKWKHDLKGQPQSVILLDIFDWNTFIYCASHTAQYLAKLTHSSIESFSFAGGLLNRLGVPSRRLEKVYESFGSPLGLKKTFWTTRSYRSQSSEMAKVVFLSLKTKTDILDISIDGTKIGHLIYDTYLRRQNKPTINLKDPNLKKTIAEAYLNWYLAKDYLSKKNVKAIVTSHYVYIEYGILATIACSLNIPVFIIFSEADYLLLEMNTKSHLQVRQYWNYKSIFNQIDEKTKEFYVNMAKKMLDDRISGKKDKGTQYYLTQGTPDLSGYGALSPTPLLKNTGRPRVLILLNCFFDSPHGYRYLLFPDMWEWLDFLLTKGSETPFDWYVKPHPSGMLANDAIVADFKRRYPKINFLGRTASNAQIVQEGISAMFTTYGTAGHEFAYMGVPVVTGGDNPHIDYSFNFHPKNHEEFEHYIKNAGRLKLDINKQEILEFFSVHYFHSYKPNSFGARLIDHEFTREVLGEEVNDPSIFENFIAGESPEKEKKMKAYYDSFFASYFSSNIKANKNRTWVDSMENQKTTI